MWIDLKDELPEKHVTVLLCIKGNKYKWIDRGDFTDKNGDEIIFDNPDWFHSRSDFTHWMYQPKHVDDCING